MTIETRKTLSIAAWLASAVCAMSLVVSALAAAAHQAQHVSQGDVPAAWLDAEIHAPR